MPPTLIGHCRSQLNLNSTQKPIVLLSFGYCYTSLLDQSDSDKRQLLYIVTTPGDNLTNILQAAFFLQSFMYSFSALVFVYFLKRKWVKKREYVI